MGIVSITQGQRVLVTMTFLDMSFGVKAIDYDLLLSEMNKSDDPGLKKISWDLPFAGKEEILGTRVICVGGVALETFETDDGANDSQYYASPGNVSFPWIAVGAAVALIVGMVFGWLVLRETRLAIGPGGLTPAIKAAGETAGIILIGAIVLILIWKSM